MTSMDFFGHQTAAHRASRMLVVWFALAVAGIVVAVYFAAAVTAVGVDQYHSLWNPRLLVVVATGVLLVVAVGALTKMAELRSGGAAVAHMLGGRQVDPGTRDDLDRRLINVVEEMAIASGVPVPDVFVLDEEQGVNAFAAGWGTADAAVAVTRGCLEALDRDQLQGVIAHEFSHVFHGDMRLNIRLMGVLFGIVCIASIGEILLRTAGRSGGGRKNAGAGLAMFGLFLFAIGWIGVFFAGLIKAAVSRQREFLADASAVAYTRNAHGIGTALARIGGIGTQLRAPAARQASHMLFADGMQRWFGSLGATHPPLEQRIERVLPGYLAELRRGGSPEQAAARVPAPSLAGVAAFAGTGTTSVASDDIVGLVGTVAPRHVAAAKSLLAELPLDLVGAARDPQRAPALLYALLLDRSATDAQTAILDRSDAALAHEARALASAVHALAATTRLPLLELLLPALRRLPPARRAELLTTVDALARADGALSTFEFALLKTVRRHVPAPGNDRARAPGKPVPLTMALAEAEIALSVLARAGTDANAAFAAGAQVLDAALPLQLRAPAECGLDAFDRALDRLAQVSPLGKKLLLTACARAVAADGQVAPQEGELLRAVAESLDCPLPPEWS